MSQRGDFSRRIAGHTIQSMSHRPEQVASVLRHAIQVMIIRGLNDPRVQGLVSVTGVRVSPDLSEATVLISVLPDTHSKLTLTGLQHASGYIQKSISREVSIRRIPKLHFQLDQSLKKQAEFEAALRHMGESHKTPKSTSDTEEFDEIVCVSSTPQPAAGSKQPSDEMKSDQRRTSDS